MDCVIRQANGATRLKLSHTYTHHDCATSMRPTTCLETQASLSQRASEGLRAECAAVNELGLLRNMLCYRWSESKGSDESVQQFWCSFPVCLCVTSFTHSVTRRKNPACCPLRVGMFFNSWRCLLSGRVYDSPL